MLGKSMKREGVMCNCVKFWKATSRSNCALRFTRYSRRGQAVLLATLVMFVVAAVGAGFILFVQSSMNLSQRARQEEEAFLLARAGLLFADRQLTEKGADWRPSVMVAFDEFERSRGWHRPDKDNDWYGKYAARQITDLLGRIQGAGGAFLLKVKYVPEQQVIKIISIGRPAPNSPVFRRLVAYKPLPTDWIWVTADGDDQDPLLLRVGIDDNGNPNQAEYTGYFVRLGQRLNWSLQLDPSVNRWIWLNAERDPLAITLPPVTDPQRLNWLRLRAWLSPSRLPVNDTTFVFTSTIRANSDLLWYGVNALQVTNFFNGAAPLVEVSRRIQHSDDDGDLLVGEDPLDGQDNDNDGRIDEDPLAIVLVYDQSDQFVPSGVAAFLNGAVPSNFGTPPGNGFWLFPIGGVPRYMDGWERLGGILPVRWVFNFPRRTKPRTVPSFDIGFYLAQTRDAAPPASHFGYFSVPPALNVLAPSDPNALPPFYTVRNDTNLLVFRGIYIDNNADRQFVDPTDAPDIDGDNSPDPLVFVDNVGNYRPELAQVFDWVVKPPQVVYDPNNPLVWTLHPRRTQVDSGWLQDNNVLVPTERNLLEFNQPANWRMAAPNLYVPPGVEVRFEVVRNPQNPQQLIQRTWLIRHDGQPFRYPNGVPFTDDPNTPENESIRLVFVDLVQLGQFDADGDGRFGEDPVNNRDDDGDGFIDEDPAPDADGDGRTMEDPVNFSDDDNDGLVDEDPPHTAQINGQIPQIVIVAEGNIRVSGQVAVSVKIITPETIYIEGPLHPVTSNATIELLAGRNVCVNLAAARTPIPSDGLNALVDRATLLPRLKVFSVTGNIQGLQGIHYPLPNTHHTYLRHFSDWLGGGVTGFVFPVPQDNNGDRLVDGVDVGGNPLTSQVIFALTGSNLPLSQDLTANFSRLLSGTWTLRLVLLHRGMAAVQDPNNPANWLSTRNPWTNLQVEIWFDENLNGQLDTGEPRFRLYGPGEPMRTFPSASRWYQGDGRQINPNDPTTVKEWGILDLPIPYNAPGLLVDRDNDGQVTTIDLWLSMQLMRITVTSPVAGEVIPQGRTPVHYELAGIKLALYDDHGIPRPIWQISPDPRSPVPSPFFILAQTIHAERGTLFVLAPDYFDPTAHPSWQQLVSSTQQQWQDNFRVLQRQWSLYYLRHNSVRLTLFLDPNDPTWQIPNNLRPQLIAQSIPIIAGQIITRVTPQTILWRLATQIANLNFPIQPDAVRFSFESALDKAALPYWADLDPNNRLADLLNLQRPVPPVFVEVPRAMFASSLIWSYRFADVNAQGVLNLGGSVVPRFYRTHLVPNLRLSPGFFAVFQQQVGED